ncbi:MAG: hypothetical protein AAF281_15995 [Pseudomonadota bacterium]
MMVLVIFGALTTCIGLAGLGLCIRRAASLRQLDDAEAQRRAMRGLVALNMGSVGVAFFGLALVVVGLIL